MSLPGIPLDAADVGAVVARVARMVHDEQAQALVRARGLELLAMTWEDSARYKHSAVGPNISDMTIQVERAGREGGPAGPLCMPVIRAPNFHDRSGDIAPERFGLLVGNERGAPLRRVTLRELLEDLPGFLHDPQDWVSPVRSLLALARDSHVLVSAQACLLPVPRAGLAEFTPVLFNYASRDRDPAVLTILASREGTSITVVDPAREPAQRTWGQPLYFNDDGRRCLFTAQRLSEFQAATGDRGDAAADEALGRVLLVQVPLKTRSHDIEVDPDAVMAEPVFKVLSGAREGSDLEQAVVGHGRRLGPFSEIDGLDIERDPRFPVRVTVQFYQATATGELSEADLQRIAAQIERVYSDAACVGSLVTEGDTGRPTEHDGDKVEPPDWWPRFWADAAAGLPLSQRAALAKLRAVLGADLGAATPEQAAALLQQPAAD